MVNGKNKGNAYERLVASQLSLWWSEGKQDDIFFRSASSGGRATQRAKKGLATANAAGDIAAMTAEGQRLLDHFCVELKRGFNTTTISDLIDNKGGAVAKFIDQASRSASVAGARYFLLIHKRDRRDAVLITNCEYFTTPTSPVIVYRSESPLEFLYMTNFNDCLCPEVRSRVISAISADRKDNNYV